MRIGRTWSAALGVVLALLVGSGAAFAQGGSGSSQGMMAKTFTLQPGGMAMVNFEAWCNDFGAAFGRRRDRPADPAARACPGRGHCASARGRAPGGAGPAPLTAINAGLGLLEDTARQQLSADQFRLLHNARRNGERLKRLINDLLTYNRLIAGALPLQREPVDLCTVAGEARAAVHSLAEHKSQTLTLDLPAALLVTGDRHQLERALVNLLCNAHEHTASGTHITLGGKANGSEISLTVQDDVPGIPVEAHETIFKPFHRHASSGSGSGLGLAIARKVIELHGGRVWVESAPGAETAFQIVLPGAERDEPQERSGGSL